MPRRFGLLEIAINFDTFDYRAVCVVGPQKKLERYVQWAFSDKTFSLQQKTYEGLFLSRDGVEPIVWIPCKPKTPKDYGTLVHECMHLVHYMMNWANISLTDDTDEIYGFVLGHTVNSIIRGLR